MVGGLSKLGSGIWRRVTRKKHVDVDDVKTELNRCMSTKRLTLIGLGRTVGVGIYILIGVATKEYAGPAVILSFLIAFLVTLLNALCFAEYASKNPKTGAQYTYMYEAVGEGIAFLVGWTSIVGCVTALSLEARGWSGYLDSLFNHAIQNYTMTHIGHWSKGPPFSDYPDFPAIFIVVVVMVVSSIGVNFSSRVNSVLTIVSGSVLVFITIVGLFYADFNNWFNVPGGFFPFGLKGILKGSSACFYAFLGFDVIGLSAEETKNPQKAIPRAIICELLIVTFLYLGVAISFSLMIPYTMISTNAPFPSAFAYHSVTWAKYIVVIGPLVALSNLCTLEMYAITRMAYSMASDGLLFSVFSKINKHTNVPIMSILIVGPVSIGIVLGLDLKNVVSFMVIYTFLMYSFFACYLLVLRYDTSSRMQTTNHIGNGTNVKMKHNMDAYTDVEINVSADGTISNNSDEGTDTDRPDIIQNCKETVAPTESKMSTRNQHKSNTNISGMIGTLGMFSEVMTVTKCATTIYVSSFLLAIILVQGSEDLLNANPMSVYSVLTLSVIILLSTLCVYCKDQNGDSHGYSVPMMPFSPVICILCNMLLLVSVAETGSIIAATLLAAVGFGIRNCFHACNRQSLPIMIYFIMGIILSGAVIYMAIVITDVIKHGPPSTSRDLTSQEQARLLTDADSDDTDFEQETVH